MYSTITDVKEVSIYVSEHVCIPKMQLVKFIILEIFKFNEENSVFKRENKKKMQTTSCILERQMKDSEQIFLLYNCRFLVLINTQPGTFYFWDQISCFARSLKDQWLNLVKSLHHYSLFSTTQTNATKTSLQI